VHAATSSTRSLIFQVALDAARRAIAQQPLTFTVANAIHGRAAIVTAVRGGRRGRFSHRLVTTGPVAKNVGMFFCCVTTRRLGGVRRGLLFLRRFGFGCLPLASLAFRLGMLPASFGRSATFLLPLGGLPATQLLQAFRFSAIALVRPLGMKPLPAAFAKTNSPPQPSASGTHTVFIGMLNLSHGR
jgi:hypothetical protein